jgi:hypothetical protein
VFIEAIKQNKGVVFSKDNFFHLRRPTLATIDRGWGTPLLLPVLKDVFYMQIMKKAQESILLEHIIPLRILFPQAGSGTSDPYCLSSSSIVEANLDYKRAEDVRVGDLVKTASGALLPVSAVVKRPVRAEEGVFKLTICGMGAVPLEPSEEHPFLAVQMHGKQKRKEADWFPKWVEAKELQVGDYVAYPLHREVKDGMQVDMAAYLPSYIATDSWIYRQITEEGAKAYEFVEQREQRTFATGELQQTAQTHNWSVGLLQTAASRYRRGHRTQRVPRFLPWSKDLATVVGYYLAEGCVDDDKIIFALNASESWICDELDGAFENLTGRKGRRDPALPNGLRYVINDSIFSEFLKNYCGHLAWNKKFPYETIHLPESILAQLVRCTINGDGGAEQSVRNNGTGRPCRTSSVTYTTTSLALALKLRELLLYLGTVSRVHTTPIRKRMKHTIHRVKVNGQMAVDLWKRLGWSIPAAPIKKDTARCFIRGGYAYFRVQKKELIEGVDFVYGFQVDGDKSFCVPACATHNTTINLTEWREHVAGEIGRWRMDPNYIPIMPLPIGNQTIGGDGKNLLLAGEIQQWSEWIIMGMGVPREFLQGGLSYAGTNVSMRMLENAFIGYILSHKGLARWIMRSVASFLKWPEVKIRFKPFKMADDIQRKAYLFQLNQAQKVSDTTLLADVDLNQGEENQIMERETDARLNATKKQQTAMAEMQGQQQLIMMKYQAKAQEEQMKAQGAAPAEGEPGGPETMDQGAPGGQMAGAPGGGAASAQAGAQIGRAHV